MATGRRRYLAYLLRLWGVGTNGELVWRASLEDPHTGERHSFAMLEQLLAFLQERTRDINRSPADEVGARVWPDPSDSAKQEDQP